MEAQELDQGRVRISWHKSGIRLIYQWIETRIATATNRHDLVITFMNALQIASCNCKLALYYVIGMCA